MDSTRVVPLNPQEIMQATGQLLVLNSEHSVDVECASGVNERLKIVRKLKETSDTYQIYC